MQKFECQFSEHKPNDLLIFTDEDERIKEIAVILGAWK